MGTVLKDVEGIVDERHGSHRLQLTRPLALPAAAYPLAPRVAGTLKIAAFNLENLFNGDGHGGGFPTPRGAKTPAQLQAQLAKLVATVRALDADVAALMELENDGYGPDSSLAQFVAALNAKGGDWRFIDAGQGPGPDTIRVGLIYRASRITPVGQPATLAAVRSAIAAGCRWRRRSGAGRARRSWSWPTTSNPRAARKPPAPIRIRATPRVAGMRCGWIRRNAWTRG